MVSELKSVKVSSVFVDYRGESVGRLEGANPDMWCMEGDWKRNGSALASAFEIVVGILQSRDVLGDCKQGVVVLCRSDGEDPFMGVSVGFNKGYMGIRKLSSVEAVEWAMHTYAESVASHNQILGNKQPPTRC